MLDGLRNRAQIARAVVDHRHCFQISHPEGENKERIFATNLIAKHARILWT
jgi:hypothetical protein